jgi:competence protein ComFC
MVGQIHLQHSLYHYLWKTLDLLFPPLCGGCGLPGVRWCQPCKDEVTPLVNHSCPLCARPQQDKSVCSICKNHPSALRSLQAYGIYSGSLRKAIQKIKYHHDVGLAEELSNCLAELYITHLKWEIDIITTVPLSEERYFERGYNQANIIALPFSLLTKSNISPHVLKRIRNTSSQVGLSKQERMNNIKNAFSITKVNPKGKKILIIDDVTTTGSTLNECAKVLIGFGALEVYGLTLAKTPFRGSLSEKYDEDLIS